MIKPNGQHNRGRHRRLRMNSTGRLHACNVKVQSLKTGACCWDSSKHSRQTCCCQLPLKDDLLPKLLQLQRWTQQRDSVSIPNNASLTQKSSSRLHLAQTRQAGQWYGSRVGPSNSRCWVAAID